MQRIVKRAGAMSFAALFATSCLLIFNGASAYADDYERAIEPDLELSQIEDFDGEDEDDFIDEEELSVEELHRLAGVEPPQSTYDEVAPSQDDDGLAEPEALANDATYTATAQFARGYRAKNITGCMQNFDVFKYGDNSVMLASMGGGNKATIRPLIKLSNASKVYEPIGGTFSYTGHADSVEVIEHNGRRYLLYVEYELYTGDDAVDHKNFTVVCKELLMNGTSGITWGDERRLRVFPASEGKYQTSCKICSSENYLCIVTAYGKDMANDKERFLVYGKTDFMNALLSNPSGSTKPQGSVGSARVATGTFSGLNQSIGMEIDLQHSVISSYELDEAGSDVIVVATVHNRASDTTLGCTQHYINRAYISLKKGAMLTQNMAQNKCYYSKVVTLVYPGPTKRTQKLSLPSGADEERFEFEGIKKVSPQGDGTKGWYISVHSKRFNEKFIDATSLASGTFKGYAASNVPWNMFVYKPVTTPTAVWNP